MPFQKALENWDKIRPNTYAGYSQNPIVNLVNSETKKKPHNIQINNNKKEPTVRPNVKYSDKQNFRRYKTKVEPKLHSKILINEEDDIVSKIKEAFGIKKPNTNYQEVETAPGGSMITNISEEPTLNFERMTNDKVDRLNISELKRLLSGMNKYHREGDIDKFNKLLLYTKHH